MKTAKPKTVELTVTESGVMYAVSVVRNVSIRIRCTRKVGSTLTDNHEILPSLWGIMQGTPPPSAILKWIAVLTPAQRNELGRIKREGEQGIAQDWIEEHGGERGWLILLNVRRISEPIMEEFDTEFNIGDSAEHSSCNLAYFGTIRGITDKTVTIEDPYQGVKRLKLVDFCWRNYKGIGDALQRNREWTD